ncbi:MAG: ATP-binding protein [Pseudomonadota bacterium]
MRKLKMLFAPAVTLMLRLKYPYKFAAIGVLALAEILYLFYPFAANLQRDIDTARQELAGLAVDKPLLVLVQKVQQHRGLSAAVVGGVTALGAERAAKQVEVQAAVAAVDGAVAEHGARLNVVARWHKIKEHWTSLRNDGMQMSVDANRVAHTDLIKELLQMVTQVGDTSLLILDPDANSYYLMAAVTHHLPGTLELLGQLRAHGTGVLATKSIDDAGRTSFAGEVAVLYAKREELEATLNKIEATSPQVADRVYDFRAQFRNATDATLQIVREDILNAKFSTPPALYVAKTTAAIDLGFEYVHEVLSPLLQELLLARIDRFQQQVWRGAMLVLAFVLVFSYLAAGVYLAVMSSIRTLQDGADRMAGGDLTTPIALQTRDELLGVAASFNHMGAQLSQRTDQLHQTGATLLQVQAEYDKDHSLAVMAAIVPAIAHDLNTPIGNINLAATALAERLKKFQDAVAAGAVKRSDLSDFLVAMTEGVGIIETAGMRAGDLAVHLKDFAVDQVSGRRRKFALDRLLDEVLSTMAPTLRGVSWRIERQVPAGLELDSYPGPLGQVLLNLVQNAAVHAFAAKADGVLSFEANAIDHERLRLVVRDNGCGMAPETAANVFAPFFTTKLEQGGSGVGLTYAQRLVRDTLGGSLRVESQLGQGTAFTLEIPLVAP